MKDKQIDPVDSFVQALDEENASVDELTLARLQSIRQSALNKRPARKKQISSWGVWGLSGASFASLVLAVFLSLSWNTPNSSNVESMAHDFEWLLNADELELVSEDLAFYDWLEAELENTPADT